MAIDQSTARRIASRLAMSRLRILANHGFYGLLLSHMVFALDETLDTAATDGRKIYFGPKFVDAITDSELDFVLMHEILHIVLMHCLREGDRSHDGFNIACDIVVNSNILNSFGGNVRRISIGAFGGEAMHIAPDGKEGYLYTAEEVYDMLPSHMKRPDKGGGSGMGGDNGKDSRGDGNSTSRGNASTNGKITTFDDHSRWASGEIDNELVDTWAKRFEDAVKVVTISEGTNTWGNIPAFAQRILKERREAQTNWREILHNFIQEEINDYSFSPPDKRFGEYDFFLPDFNETEDSVKNILFMIDTSGSMTDDMITDAFNEVRGALTQFNGRLEGMLGFFDAVAVPPVPFSSIDELEVIRPIGGGGTNFGCIFKYVKEKMDTPPSSIIILTDGYAPIPPEREAMDIPVLWVINNEEVTPEWGKIARIKGNNH